MRLGNSFIQLKSQCKREAVVEEQGNVIRICEREKRVERVVWGQNNGGRNRCGWVEEGKLTSSTSALLILTIYLCHCRGSV